MSLPEPPDHRREFVAAPDLCVLVDKGGDLVEHSEVRHCLFDDLRPLHFYGDRTAVAQCGAMHLPEGGRRDRLRIERQKRLRQPYVELAFYRFLYIGERHGLDVVLQAAQRFEIGRRQQVGPRRQQLAQLHERRTQGFEVFREAFRLGGVMTGGRA
jgi:hypothetical protein